MKKVTRYQWNSTHPCHVCGVFAGFPCSYTCSRNGLRLGAKRQVRKQVRPPKNVEE